MPTLPAICRIKYEAPRVTQEHNHGNPDLWAKEAIDHLRQDGLSPTPDNFAVYYAYHSDTNPNLKMAMAALVEQYGKLAQTQCTDLFLAHLSLEAESKVIQTTTNSIAEEIKIPILREVGRDLQRGNSGFVNIGNLGSSKNWWVYYKPIPSNKWGVLLVVPEK